MQVVICGFHFIYMTQCVIKLAGNGGQGGEGGLPYLSALLGGGEAISASFQGGGVNLTLCCVVLISETPAPENYCTAPNFPHLTCIFVHRFIQIGHPFPLPPPPNRCQD